MARFALLLYSLFISNILSAQSIEDLQQTQLKEQASHQSEVKAAMRACTAATQDDDVLERNLAKNVQLELGDTCIVQKASLDSIKLLNKQIINAFQVVDAGELWSDINKIALERTAKSVWSTYMKLIKDEKLNEASAIALVCKYTPKLCKIQDDLKIIKNAFASFQKETAKKPVKFLTGPEQDKILHSELGPLIDRANKTCEVTKKKYLEIKTAYGCFTMIDFSKQDYKPSQPMSQGECDARLEMAYKKHKELEQIAAQSIKLDMQLIVGSQLGSLLITEDLRNKVGVLKEDFTYEKCMKGSGHILGHVWNKDILKAREDFFALTVKELQKIEDNKASDNSAFSKKQTLKQYLKTNPSTVAELLRQNNDPSKVFAICSLIKSIQGWDSTWKVVDGAIVGSGVIASIALGFTGVGAPAGAALASVVLGSTVLGVTKSAIDYSAQVHQDTRTRTATATQQKNLDQAMDDLQVSDLRKESYLDNIKTSVVSQAASFGLGKGLKLLGQVKQTKNLKQVVAVEQRLNPKSIQQDEKVILRLKLEKNPQTSALYGKLSPQDQQRLLKVTQDLEHMKFDEAENLKRISSLQTNCLQKGVFKYGCFQTQLTKIEREISSHAIHAYMKEGYAQILNKAKNTEKLIKTSPKPVVYDVVSIGSGPHNGIAINAMKDVDPKLKILVVEKSQNLGVFHQVKGFNINTPEYLKRSGNTFPGSPTQLKDFNPNKRIFAGAEELGEQTQATYTFADADMVFKNKVMTVTKEPTPGAWPAKWKIETDKGLIVYSKAGISAQGFGDFSTRLKDPKTLEIIEKYHSAYIAKNLVKDTKYAPPISSVDDLLPTLHQDARLGRYSLGRFENGDDVLVVGAGDGGNIAIEALTGLNREMNPSGVISKVKIKWLGQEATSSGEFSQTLKPRTVKRYANIGATIDSKQVQPINGYLSRIEEFKDETGKLKFKAYYTTKTGEPVGEPIITSNIVFSTGYPNDQSHILPMFNKMAGPENISFQPITGEVDDFTRYPQFKQQEIFTSRELTVNGEAQDWFSVGVGGKIPSSTIEKTGIPVGGSIDVLAPKSATTGRTVAQKVSTVSNLQPLVPSNDRPHSFTLQQRPSMNMQYKFDNEAVVKIDMKLQIGKTLRGYTISPHSEIAVVVRKNNVGSYHFKVQGLDQVSSQQLVNELGKNADFTHDLNSYFNMGKFNIEIKVGSRSTGQFKLEDLQVNTSQD